MKIFLGNIDKAVVHQVGNKTIGDGVKFSSKESSLDNVDNEINQLLKKVFLFEDTYQFYFEPTLSLNPVYTFIRNIFDDSNRLIEESQNISRYLYEKSVHPKMHIPDYTRSAISVISVHFGLMIFDMTLQN